MVAAFATMMIGSELQMVVADEDMTFDEGQLGTTETGSVGNNDYSGAGSGNEGVPTSNGGSLVSTGGSSNVIGGSGASTGTLSSSDYEPPSDGNNDDPDQPDQPGSQCGENDDNPLQCDEQQSPLV